MVSNSTTIDTNAQSSLQSFLGSMLRAREFGIFAFLLVAVIVIGAFRPSFLTTSNLLNMGRQMAQVTIMAAAMTYLITAQELDLSVGSVFGLCSLVMALLAKELGLDLWLSLAIVMVLAAVIGLINGLITTRGGIPSFIVTLGMLYIVRGITLMVSAWPISRLQHPNFFEVLAGDVAGIPTQIFWMLGIVAIGFVGLSYTTFGYQVRATGSNRGAAELSGIRVKRVKITAFVLTAVAAAFAGALSFAHLTSVAPTAGAGLELTVIAAAVIGGTALAGGQGTIIGTLLGSALLVVMRNGLVQLGGEGRLQEAFLGAIIIIAVLIHTHLSRK